MHIGADVRGRGVRALPFNVSGFLKGKLLKSNLVAPELASIKHSKIRVALIIIYQRLMTVVGYDKFFLCCKFLP